VAVLWHGRVEPELKVRVQHLGRGMVLRRRGVYAMVRELVLVVLLIDLRLSLADMPTIIYTLHMRLSLL
jgi:hypothetical protein